MTITAETPVQHEGREFDLIPGRRFVKVAEWLGSREDGQRTVRAFIDPAERCVYHAADWNRRDTPMGPDGQHFYMALLDAATGAAGADGDPRCPSCGAGMDSLELVEEDQRAFCNECATEVPVAAAIAAGSEPSREVALDAVAEIVGIIRRHDGEAVDDLQAVVDVLRERGIAAARVGADR